MLYAAYGSNLHPLRLGERTPSAQLLGTCKVAGWALHFHKRGQDASAKCNVRRATGGDGHGIHVAIYELRPADKRKLDVIEGLGCGYREGRIDIPGFGEVMTYLADDGFVADGLLPYDWYRDLVWLGCRRHGFPSAYVERVRSQAAATDPDSARHARNHRLVHRLRAALELHGR